MAEDIVAYLTAPPMRLDRTEAELIAEDADLWICDPAMRHGFEGEEAVEK
jgi:hypothetical protein